MVINHLLTGMIPSKHLQILQGSLWVGSNHPWSVIVAHECYIHSTHYTHMKLPILGGFQPFMLHFEGFFLELGLVSYQPSQGYLYDTNGYFSTMDHGWTTTYNHGMIRTMGRLYIYLHEWLFFMVKYGFHVGTYTSPMDAEWDGMILQFAGAI